MTMRDGRVDDFDSSGGVQNTDTIDTDRHGKVSGVCRQCLFQRRLFATQGAHDIFTAEVLKVS